MSGLYERLNRELDSQEQPAGITTMDIMEMPGEERAILLLLLRDKGGSDGIPYETLAYRFEQKMPDLYGTLRQLAARGWIVEMGEAPDVRFRINMRARRGIDGAGLWTALNDRML